MYYQRNHPAITIMLCNALTDEDHLHNEFELVYCLKGEFNAIINSSSYTVKEGQISLSFPNQNHYYSYNKDSELKVYVLIFSIRVLTEIEKLLSSSLPSNPVFSFSDRCEAELLLQKMYESRSKDELSVLKRSGLLKLLSAEIFSNVELMPSRMTDPKILSGIVDYCNNNFKNDIHLKDLEEHLHINKYYISHIFKDKVNMGFSEYINALRIEAAQKALTETSDTITTIAYNVGYNNVRNFNRSFLKITGMTPGKFRKLKEKK